MRPDPIPPPNGAPAALALYHAARWAPAAAAVRSDDWQRFAAWCAGFGFIACPAAPRTVALYLVAHAGHCSPVVLGRWLGSIAAHHHVGGLPFDRDAGALRPVLAALRRVHAPGQRTTGGWSSAGQTGRRSDGAAVVPETPAGALAPPPPPRQAGRLRPP